MREARRTRADATQVAADPGVDIATPPTARRPRAKRQPNRNGPVEKTVLWATVSDRTKAEALERAGGDIKRCKPLSTDTVVVLNNPRKEPPR